MPSEIIIFIGRLLERPSDAPRCGDSKVAVAFRFAVQKLVKGSTREKVVVVLIPCPDFKGEKFFIPNADYQIEASTDLQEAGSYDIYNDYTNAKLFWCVEIIKA